MCVHALVSVCVCDYICSHIGRPESWCVRKGLLGEERERDGERGEGERER